MLIHLVPISVRGAALRSRPADGSGHMTRSLFILSACSSDIRTAEGRPSVPASRRLGLGVGRLAGDPAAERT